MKLLDLLTTDPKHRASAILAASLRVYPHQPHLCVFFRDVAVRLDRRRRGLKNRLDRELMAAVQRLEALRVPDA